MLNSKSASFPHPVLGFVDDMEGSFTIEGGMEIDRESRELIFTAACQVDCPYVENLLREGMAQFAILLKCSCTMQTWVLGGQNKKKRIPEKHVRHSLSMQAVIVATRSIPEYRDDCFNSLFGERSFSIDPGDIIGTAGSHELRLPEEDEQLGLGSLFKFTTIAETEPLDFDFHGDKIEIRYPGKEENNPTRLMFRRQFWAAYNVFILPALTEAMKELDANRSEYEESGYSWVSTLDSMLPENERTGVYHIDAQRVLGNRNPILAASKEFITAMENEN